MFSHTAFFQAVNFNAPKALLLSLAVGAAMTAQANETVLEIAPETAHADLASSEAAAHMASAISDSEKHEAMFYECATITEAATRLACFDTLAQGDTPTVIAQKRPIALGDSIKPLFKGDVQVVRVDPNAPKSDDSLSDTPAQDVRQYSPLSLAFDLDKNSDRGLWTARPHNPTYMLPLFINGKPNRYPSTPSQETPPYKAGQMRENELKFQISLKMKAAEDLFGTDADLWLGYTQQSHWQVFNAKYSRPFRAHDYQPELFVTQPVVADLPFGGKLRMLGAGVMHHSNGEDDPWSRSWNRAYVMGGMEWDKLTIMPRLWGRILKENPDDNPDITDYYGYGDVRFLYQMNDKDNLAGTVRFNPATGKGALQVDYTRQLGKGISGYVQFFQGYGQSIVDYNHETTAVGVGVMLDGFMGL
ncbi:hypothetical protein B0181_08965 [Moraxella caviae]|uniref:Phospholipase A1 n=1 Tax=Moraxella caviae TaxID=34060 RepID=A0A1S9ZXI5_9GAMM|nr:hypothetical protein B0181_08965 [Moraxella caviae]